MDNLYHFTTSKVRHACTVLFFSSLAGTGRRLYKHRAWNSILRPCICYSSSIPLCAAVSVARQLPVDCHYVSGSLASPSLSTVIMPAPRSFPSNLMINEIPFTSYISKPIDTYVLALLEKIKCKWFNIVYFPRKTYQWAFLTPLIHVSDHRNTCLRS